MDKSQPTTPESGPATSSRWLRFRPAGPKELDESWTGYLSDPIVRAEIQTVMTLLECEAWQAVFVREVVKLRGAIVEDLDRAAEEERDSWPGKSDE
ncbi:MAG: hypothetical protein V3R16_09690 [Nitrospirales bacterium]